ncbi:extracellular solute-binding protein [Paenibacillus sp. TAB 01]|uniref:extracellular solute-binding protein n=1 Tax=Paenibacillus sp. TAB 01 TaxID=3368988 RepID=UPI003753A624
MKKISIGLLALTLGMGAALSGCSGADDPEGSGKDDASQSSAAAVSPAGQFPITSEKTTIKVLMKGSASVEDFATNEFTKWLEQKTNIHIDWEVAPEKSATEKLNLVLSSGDYPDVIMGFGVSPTQMMINGSQGVFLPLNSLIDKYGVEIQKMFKENPIYKDLITAPDGNIYALPQVNECYHCMYKQRMWIHKPWLDKLGLKMPTTTDEFYEVLKAFKTRDPNGNGKADEIPLSGSIQASASNLFDTQMLDSFLMNAFIYDHDTRKLYLDNGKVTVPYNKPEWKEGLKYIHKLYAEGLIDPQALTQDNNQLKKLGENPDTVILGASSGHNMGSLTTLGASSGRWLTYEAVPPLKVTKRLPNGGLSSVCGGQWAVHYYEKCKKSGSGVPLGGLPVQFPGHGAEMVCGRRRQRMALCGKRRNRHQRQAGDLEAADAMGRRSERQLGPNRAELPLERLPVGRSAESGAAA